MIVDPKLDIYKDIYYNNYHSTLTIMSVGSPTDNWSHAKNDLSHNDESDLLNQSSESQLDIKGASFLDDSQYIIGLSVLLAMILLGVCASMMMLLTLKKDPILWNVLFNGFKFKSNTDVEAKFPRKVRFSVKGKGQPGDSSSHNEDNNFENKSMVVATVEESEMEEVDDV